ncbi:Gfo/Idh/MocA family protein [Paenibacillus koleovorans]|uniref:Gfo/Idh/MocA family protein n=1 Tax=Paenibacillus koleovorans TaxID=121608 RepID=UPI000FDAD275|nr:Gfo/Idh/MocA family oxidoreductase [Paenibacillus koleovorans]
MQASQDRYTSQKSKADAPLRVVVVGAGSRSRTYASYGLTHPEELQIVAVVDPDEGRCNRLADLHRLPADRRFGNLSELFAAGKIADAAINGTMDELHVSTSLSLMEAGYDILLEKPIGISKEEVLALLAATRSYNRKVMICHVLRYAPFYLEIRKRIAAGEIGDVLNIQTAEHVSYHHMSAAFVRGKWSSKAHCGSSMLMAKCCHDMDLITWLKSGIPPIRVASSGGLSFFRRERAPVGSGKRCLADCTIEADCSYSARKHYVDKGLWGVYVWRSLEHLGPSPTVEQKLESLRTDNPYGRCVWQCDNDAVDHQSVLMEFADGSTATHNLVGNTARPCRTIHIIGTKGEISGVMEDGYFNIRHEDERVGHEYTEERIHLNVSMDMHGGGDLRLMEDFIRYCKGQEASLSTTSLADSIYGHMLGFGADQAMQEAVWVPLETV